MTPDETRSKFPNVRPDKQYKRLDNGEILTGERVLYLLSLAKPTLQAIILLSIQELDEPALTPCNKGGCQFRVVSALFSGNYVRCEACKKSAGIGKDEAEAVEIWNKWLREAGGRL